MYVTPVKTLLRSLGYRSIESLLGYHGIKMCEVGSTARVITQYKKHGDLAQAIYQARLNYHKLMGAPTHLVTLIPIHCKDDHFDH